MEILKEAATVFGYAPAPIFSEDWTRPGPVSNLHEIVPFLTDEVISAQRDQFIFESHAFLKSRAVTTTDRAVVSDVCLAFDRMEPFDGNATLPEIIAAAWASVLKRPTFSEVDEKEWHAFLRELIFKTIEVSEYRVKTKRDGA